MDNFTFFTRSSPVRRAALVASAALGLVLLGVAGCAAPAPSAQISVGQALRADPRFSDFVEIVDFAGLGHSLNDARNVTIFAPTNTAFDRTDPTWRTRVTPSGTTNFDVMNQAREQVIKETVLAGIHPPGEFLGKLQDVQSESGRVFHVNGLVDGTITITAGVASPTGMGFLPARPNQTAKVEFPPVSTAGGLIYPIDTIIR
jgi:hypothetical protein